MTLIAIIKSMWSFYPSILLVIGAECMRCENIMSRFHSFSWNGHDPDRICIPVLVHGKYVLLQQIHLIPVKCTHTVNSLFSLAA